MPVSFSWPTVDARGEIARAPPRHPSGRPPWSPFHARSVPVATRLGVPVGLGSGDRRVPGPLGRPILLWATAPDGGGAAGDRLAGAGRHEGSDGEDPPVVARGGPGRRG